MSQGISLRVGPFMYADGFLAERIVGGTKLILVVAGAYNANGLIGPEHNGIAVLNETDRQIVLDMHVKAETGYFGPTKPQVDEFKRLAALTDADFISFCRANPRFREGSLGKLEPPKPRDQRSLMVLHESGISYNHGNKQAFKTEGQRLLRALAKAMGLSKGEFEVRYNAGGIAVTGDHTLHTPRMYLTFNADLGDLRGYSRACSNAAEWKGDYGTGSQNIPFDPRRLYSDMKGVADELKRRFYC